MKWVVRILFLFSLSTGEKPNIVFVLADDPGMISDRLLRKGLQRDAASRLQGGGGHAVYENQQTFPALSVVAQ